MENVLIVAYLLIVLALIAVILLQRSEGGALGIGGGGGGFMTARGSANLLTRTTAILATLFFATAIGLTILSEVNRGSSGILERAAQGEEGTAPTSVLDALDALQGGSSDLPVPTDAPSADPAPPAGTDPVTDPTAAAPAPADTAPATDLPVPVTETPAPAAPTQAPAPAANTTAPADTPEPAPAPASN